MLRRRIVSVFLRSAAISPGCILVLRSWHSAPAASEEPGIFVTACGSITWSCPAPNMHIPAGWSRTTRGQTAFVKHGGKEARNEDGDHCSARTMFTGISVPKHLRRRLLLFFNINIHLTLSARNMIAGWRSERNRRLATTCGPAISTEARSIAYSNPRA